MCTRKREGDLISNLCKGRSTVSWSLSNCRLEINFEVITGALSFLHRNVTSKQTTVVQILQKVTRQITKSINANSKISA